MKSETQRLELVNRLDGTVPDVNARINNKALGSWPILSSRRREAKSTAHPATRRRCTAPARKKLASMEKVVMIIMKTASAIRFAGFGTRCSERNAVDKAQIVKANHELVKQLEPAKVFEILADIATVPRGSGNCGQIGDFLLEFAEKRGFSADRDATGNVIIRKPAQNASPSCATAVILQSHMDMVCVKTAESTHDFTADPIAFVLDGDWLRANDTTLGADDAIGMAITLAIFEDKELAHPALEALITVDEETSMIGAREITADQLRGDVLINLDSEELGMGCISCAASSSFELALPLRRSAQSGGKQFILSVDGLRGGHSGVQINEGRANAFALLARVLVDAAAKNIEYGVCDISIGATPGAANAIPARAEAVIVVPDDSAAEAMRTAAAAWTDIFRREYRNTDPEATVRLAESAKQVAAPLSTECRDALLGTMRLVPIGVQRFIQHPDRMAMPFRDLLVETSNNMGVVKMDDKEATITLMARGSVETALEEVEGRFKALAAAVGADLRPKVKNAGWEMAVPPTRTQELFRQEGLHLVGVHAGLECGGLVETMKAAGRTLEAISIGPDIVGPHSPDEGLRIGSVEPLYGQLTRVLTKLAAGK